MGDDGATALFTACDHGRTAIVKSLLAHGGIDANKATTDDGTTPLYQVCAQEDRAAIIKLLLAHDGIEVNKATSDAGTTPLFIACHNSCIENIKLLLAHADIDVKK